LLPQPNSSVPPPKSIFKNPSLYSYTVLVLSIFSVAWIFFSRWEQNRSIENRARQERTQKQLEEDRATLEQMGGKELAIQTFYATPGSIRRGETVQLCYGVANAKTVTLEPQSNPVWPSYSRCVDVTPAKTTTYTLTISDISGHTKSQSLEVRVR
jgi:cbb3-type cytochrome oxidase subunit 3